MDCEIDGLRIQYEVAGTGLPVLLLHGWGGSIQSFRPIINELSKTNRVYTLDFPGHGGSSDPPRIFKVADFANITRIFMRRQELEGCAVLAHSFGGRVTIWLASEEPALFSKIVLCDAAGIKPRRTVKYYWKVYTYKLLKRFRKPLTKLGVDVQKRIDAAGSDDYRALPAAMKATFSKVVNEDLTPRLKRITVPTLLIWGTEDQDTPLWMAKKMEKEIPDSGLVTFPGAGHFSYLDRLGDFLVIVKHFLSGGDKA